MTPRNQSSVAQELGWFGLWVALFVVAMLLMRWLVVPHHFNETIAIMIAGIVSAIAMIALRARLSRRARP